MTIPGDTTASRPAEPEEPASNDRRSLPRGLERALLAAIVESSDDAIASKDLDGVVTSWNHAAGSLFGYAAEEIVGRHISALAAPGREDEMPMILARIRRGERIDHYETLRRRKDGSLAEISLTVSPIRDGRGRIIGASKIARDISERRRREQERELRLGELRHRVKNLLAVVWCAIAHQTTAKNVSGQEYRDSSMGRLAALATAHEAAFQTEADTDLATLIARLLEPYAHTAQSEVITVESGPRVSLPREKVQPLAFILHELHARRLLAAWRQNYNHVRPHTAHGGIPPAAAGERLRNPASYTARPLPFRPAIGYNEVGLSQ